MDFTILPLVDKQGQIFLLYSLPGPGKWSCIHPLSKTTVVQEVIQSPDESSAANSMHHTQPAAPE